MGDESGQATIVSNHSSHESFAGLPGPQDGSSDWEPATIDYNSEHNSSNKPPNTTHPSTVVNNPSPSLSAIMPTNFPSSLIVSKSPLPILPSAGISVASAPANNTVPEFLYQLTKMLTGGHNDIIEWSNGRIEVHNPHKLESTVLQKYFRHSKFASFQRQLNYFGFRKLAGKGKMAPCSYVNEAATQDIGSLLLIKRKATVAPKDKNGRKQSADRSRTAPQAVPLSTARGGIVHQTKSSYQHTAPPNPLGSSQQAIAQSAVGRGIRHSIGLGSASAPSALPTATPEGAQVASAAPEKTNYSIPSGVQDSLSQLASNYQNSIEDLPSYPGDSGGEGQSQPVGSATYNDPFPSLLSRNSSLVDLAMIPTLDESEPLLCIPGMSFVDFPQPEIDPSNTPRSTYPDPNQQS